VPPDFVNIKNGDKIGPKTSWWRLHEEFTIIEKVTTKSKSVCVVAKCDDVPLRVGDKLGTLHGQKFVVSRIVEEDEMPLCTDTTTGLQFVPHIVMSCSSVTNRLTMGQLYESFVSADLYDVASFEPSKVYATKVVEYH
jgi:hypothetical protein